MIQQWVDQAVVEFVGQFGINAQGWAESGCLGLDFEQNGQLHIEQHPAGIMVLLSQHYPLGDAWLQTASQACDYQLGIPFPIQVGLKGSTELVFFCLLEEEQVTINQLSQLFNTLTQLHIKCRAS
ncbi:hypothetical protein H0A36_09970 [Endozoicomonas sp. SM1973]|uniref:Type III secretion chaperone SycN n=1 Tax=Spartinivicinus marinus TaxID=2994442 RepID=A0A853I9V7_9GAMM|nr:hypothetical protein [Spartinivicinus marinus]MCX4024638.1 hypothetical protein [Spartinivicinus marinus]NYZ66337.1 hypothetical protein [Spartinivicinus marinus]